MKVEPLLSVEVVGVLQVPCVAVVENMSYFEVDGVRHLPFGAGSGDRIVRDFGLPNLVRFPIIADLSAAGDGKLQATHVQHKTFIENVFVFYILPLCALQPVAHTALTAMLWQLACSCALLSVIQVLLAWKATSWVTLRMSTQCSGSTIACV